MVQNLLEQGEFFSSLLEGLGWAGGLLERFPSYAWQLLYMPLFSLVGVLLVWFMWRELPDKRSRVIVVIALACLSFAVVLDFVEGLDEDHPLNLYTYIADTFDWEARTQRAFGASTFETLAHFSRSIEDFTEMLANTLLWSVFLLHFMRLAPDLRVRFRSTDAA